MSLNSVGENPACLSTLQTCRASHSIHGTPGLLEGGDHPSSLLVLPQAVQVGMVCVALMTTALDRQLSRIILGTLQCEPRCFHNVRNGRVDFSGLEKVRRENDNNPCSELYMMK